MMSLHSVVIAEPVRTAIGTFGGTLKDIPAVELGATAISGALQRSGLRPEEIGVQLTEGFMMDPEASVSALVFQHPDCTYFSVGDAGEV